MWSEFKTYDFKYADDMNHNLYFPLEKAASIANALQNIIKRYYVVYRNEHDVRRAAELRQELANLEQKLADKTNA